MADPWMKFYPTDWRADPALRMCSPAARGVWIDMICLMHEATPYGHLLVNGRCPTDAQIAVLLGIPSDQLPDLLGELEAAGVFSRTKDGAIYSRRMTRLAKKSATARKNGRLGGNPTLRKERENPASDNQQVKGGVKTQKPEARSQIVKETPNGVSKKTGERIPLDWVLSKQNCEWAVKEGLSEFEARREADKFQDYWTAQPGAKGRKTDWDATWRNWVRKAAEGRPKAPRSAATETNDSKLARWRSVANQGLNQ